MILDKSGARRRQIWLRKLESAQVTSLAWWRISQMPCRSSLCLTCLRARTSLETTKIIFSQRKNNCSYHMEKLMPGVEKLLGKLLIPEGKLFDSEGESCFSERSEAKHSPEESKVCPRESKVPNHFSIPGKFNFFM